MVEVLLKEAGVYDLEFDLVRVFMLPRWRQMLALLVSDVRGLGHSHVELHVLEHE